MILFADIAGEIAIATADQVPTSIQIDVVGMLDVFVKGMVALGLWLWLWFRNWGVTEY